MVLKQIKKYWNYIWKEDTITSYILFFITMIVLLKIFLPTFFFITKNTIGLSDIVAVVSGSMVHDQTTPTTYENFFYEKGYFPQDLQEFPLKNGLNPGDLVIVWDFKPENIKVGDVIIFQSGELMIIHRVNEILEENGVYKYTTKGDHNSGIIESEISITDKRVKGVAKLRIPFLGLPKTILTNLINNFKIY